MSRSRVFLYCTIFFILGVGIASCFDDNFLLHNVWFFAGIISFLVLIILFYKNKKILILSLFGLFLFLGIWRYSLSIPTNSPDKIWYYNGEKITFWGIINKEPDIRKDNQKLEVLVNSVETYHSAFLQVEGKVLVTTDLYPEYNYGDILEITCNLQKPEKFNGFSYDRYLARYDIYSVCYWPERIQPHPNPLLYKERGQKSPLQPHPNFPLEGERHNEPSPLKGELEGVKVWFFKKIYSFKNSLREKINQNMNEPEASLAKAIILGDKKGIPKDLREKFSQLGLSHIIAISGMHISIIAGILMLILLEIGFTRKRAFVFATVFLFVYIAIIGFPASAIRAGIMGFLVLLALTMGRLSKMINLLFFAALILLLINPKLLRDDIGFQLSFLAVLGIGLVYPILDEFFNHILESTRLSCLRFAMTGFIRDIINITISAQVFILPIIAMNFNQVSLVVVLSNLLVIWALPILMVTIIIALVLSFVFSSFNIIFFLPSVIILKYVIILTELLSSLPLAYVKIYYIWWVWIILYYIIVGVIILLLRPKRCNLEI